MLNELKIDKLELGFDSCETITVGLGAIRALEFTVTGEEYCWDSRRKTLDVQKVLGKFHLELDIRDMGEFVLSDPVHIEKGLTEGEYLFKRLTTTDDITHIYINGVAYKIPWDPGQQYNNLWHRTVFVPSTPNGRSTVEYVIEPMKRGHNGQKKLARR